MRRRSFAKYEGLGNDFILMGAVDEAEIPPDAVRSLCDRHFGIGADGVLLVLPPRELGCVGRMKVINADGSVPEMCGNGLRCVALHVARTRGLAQAEFVFDTDAGPRRCAIDDTDGKGSVSVDMGVVRVTGKTSLDVGGRTIAFHLADAGNPHAIAFGSFSRDEAESTGAAIATHSSFPNGTNVEFARLDGGAVDLVVWERGVGITLACGTGACATVTAACEEKMVRRDEPVDVRLPGGLLSVTVASSDGHVVMRGPARHVFSGHIST